MSGHLRVIKVGGSLLEFPHLPGRLNQWLLEQRAGRDLLIAGGGRLADVVREWDRIHDLDNESAHWLCVQLMDVSARMLADLMPGVPFERCLPELRTVLESHAVTRVVFSVAEFMRTHENRLDGIALPRDWRTSSDAIAARLAVAVGANELVLLKSRDLPGGTDRREAARQGLIDEIMPQAAAGLAARWVNLRHNGSIHECAF